MQSSFYPLLVLCIWNIACSSPSTTVKTPTTTETETPQAPSSQISQENIGKKITIEGEAINRKMGAQLVSKTVDIWIADLPSWPDECISPPLSPIQTY